MRCSADFVITVGGHVWLQSGSVSVHANEGWFTYPRISGDHPIIAAGMSAFTGSDQLGSYSATSIAWRLGVTGDGDPGMLMNTTMRIYDDGVTAVFAQDFPQALEYMASITGDTALSGVADMSTAFPAFQPATNATPLNYLSYGGISLTETKLGQWGDADLTGSTQAG